MHSTLLNLILGQSYLHIVSYGLVIAILFVAVADAFLLGHLKRALHRQGTQLGKGGLHQEALGAMIHPVASTLAKLGDAASRVSPATLQRKMEAAEAALFIPLRARMSLTRDLSTLMGLIATLLALVAAASDFARHGKPELLIGSVGTGCVATCVAAIGCAIALWNLSRLTRLRLVVACETEDMLVELPLENAVPLRQQIPIQHWDPNETAALDFQPEEDHASL